MKFSRVQICGLLIILFYLVGFFGLSNSSYLTLFKFLVPFHLMLMFILVIVSHEHRNRDFWKFILSTYIAGVVIELLGVKTGLIFGNYNYGATLGYKLSDVPLIIGVNWILMIYSTGVFLKEFNIRNRTLRALVGAGLLSAVDLLIEPVAVKYDYWSWTDFEIPVQNTVGWFIFSFLMLLMFYNFKFRKNNPVGSILFVVQTLFFLALYIRMT